jgi:hypothetical protein
MSSFTIAAPCVIPFHTAFHPSPMTSRIIAIPSMPASNVPKRIALGLKEYLEIIILVQGQYRI